MPRYEIRLAGLGGQGIVRAGVIIGSAAALFGGKNAANSQSYGPEARGGASKAEVIISDEEIDYPKVEEPDAVALMSQEAYDKYAKDLKKGGVLIYDSDMVYDPKPVEGARVYAIPATRIAEEAGRKIVANMVMIGGLIAITKAVDPSAVKKSIEMNVPKGTEELNVKAFERGYEYALGLLKV
jgi:2-oxoglutarate ferredoxin oxidoreductase subunit gamma